MCTRVVFSTAYRASPTQSAQYLEDRWQVTKNLLVTAGLRNETFTNRTATARSSWNMKNQLLPAPGRSWDVNGDASMKVFGSAGRYSCRCRPMWPCVAPAVRCSPAQYYTYTGTDQPTAANRPERS